MKTRTNDPVRNIISSFLFVLLSCVASFSIPGIASAHQPIIVRAGETVVSSPEVSKAYYGLLEGEAEVFTISETQPFSLYVNVLVPDIDQQKRDVSAAVLQIGTTTELVTVLEGLSHEWMMMHEPFGNDNYLKGPEYKATVPAGDYEIRVWSTNNDSKYVLAIGEAEVFGVKETVDSVKVIPTLKQDFFMKSPVDFLLSPIGGGYLVSMIIVGLCIGLFARMSVRFVSRHLHGSARTNNIRMQKRNIGILDRAVRFVIAFLLIGYAVTHSWDAWLFVLAGVSLFQAFASWCGLYAVLGKTTCPIE